MPFLIILLSYLLGSIPTAYIAGRLIKGRDIRQMDDGNMGAQNAFRQLGARTGFSVGVIDAVKGILAILIAQIAGISQASVLLAGTAAVIGHNWPAFLGFRGGRGECTTIGVLLTLVTQPMLIAGSAAIMVLLKTRNVIKASAAMFVPLPLICWLLGVPGLLVSYSIGLPCLVGFTHFIRTRRGLAHHAGGEKLYQASLISRLLILQLLRHTSLESSTLLFSPPGEKPSPPVLFGSGQELYSALQVSDTLRSDTKLGGQSQVLLLELPDDVHSLDKVLSRALTRGLTGTRGFTFMLCRAQIRRYLQYAVLFSEVSAYQLRLDFTSLDIAPDRPGRHS